MPPHIVTRALTTLRKHGVKATMAKTVRLAKLASRRFTFRPYTIEKHILGDNFQFYLGDVTGEEWYVPYPDNPEAAWMKSRVRPGDTFIDCGCHHGMISVLASRWVGPSGRVVAFDGRPQNIEIVRRNVAINKIANLESYAFAVGSRNGHARYAPASNGQIVEHGGIEVPVVSLDQFFPDSRVNFIKMDIQGHELEGLKGARSILRRYTPALNIEVHCLQFSNPKETIGAILAEIPAERYRLELLLSWEHSVIPYEPATHTLDWLAALDMFTFLASPATITVTVQSLQTP